MREEQITPSRDHIGFPTADQPNEGPAVEISFSINGHNKMETHMVEFLMYNPQNLLSVVLCDPVLNVRNLKLQKNTSS